MTSKKRYAPELTESNKMNMVRWLEAGKSIKDIASLLDIGYHHAYVAISRLKRNPSVNKRSLCGRKRKVSAAVHQFILAEVRKDRGISAKKVSQRVLSAFGLEISPKTIVRSLKMAGMNPRSPRKVPLISPTNKKRRLEHAKKFLLKPKAFWEKVIWSDETKINLFSSDGRRWVWRVAGEEYTDACTIKTVKHGGGSIMLWGCMSSKGVGRLVEIKETMTGAKYVQILQENLFDSAVEMGLGRDFVFQQDNDPKHTSKLARKFFEDNNITLLEWPAQSPDLNIIEHMWAELKRRCGHYHATSKTDLLTKIKGEWRQLGQEYARKLAATVYKRFTAVIEAKGGATRF